MAQSMNQATANIKENMRNKANNANNQIQSTLLGSKKPMIVERVNKIPVVSFAISMGFSQYDKLKSSNANVGNVIGRAECFAAYVWEKVQPVVEKLQTPIQKADQLACNTFDFVEDKFNATSVNLSQSFGEIVNKYKQFSPLTKDGKQ